MYACGWPPDAPTVRPSPHISLCYIGNNSLRSLSVDSETSHPSLIHHISFLVQMRAPSQNGITWPELWPFAAGSVPQYLHLYTYLIDPLHIVLSPGIQTCFSPFGNVMETKYCTVKLFILPCPLLPLMSCSFQHQPLSKCSKKKNDKKKTNSLDLFVHVNSLIFMYRAMKS